jgi:hypothetical protein
LVRSYSLVVSRRLIAGHLLGVLEPSIVLQVNGCF